MKRKLYLLLAITRFPCGGVFSRSGNKSGIGEKWLVVFAFLLAGTHIFAQGGWRFEAKIERSTNYLFEGSIDGKFPISMYLEYDGFCLYENRWNYARILKGWYYYNNRKIKLPLVGSEKYYETEKGNKCNITLYVPENALDSISNNSCDVEKYKEVFVSNIESNLGMCSFETMQWKTCNGNSFLPVELKEICRPSIETKASIALYIRGVEMFSFDLTDKLKGLKNGYGYLSGSTHIESVQLEASKEIDNDFYLIFSFTQPSVPGANGMGHCGGGDEEYLAFLHVSSFEVKEFRYFLTDSCFAFIPEEYTYDRKAP